jgi:vacuolar-type H+-ATPase subunit I/STV1
MARWFRSEPMQYISLIINEDAAHSCLADLGKMGAIQFTDVSRIVFGLSESSVMQCVLFGK